MTTSIPCPSCHEIGQCECWWDGQEWRPSDDHVTRLRARSVRFHIRCIDLRMAMGHIRESLDDLATGGLSYADAIAQIAHVEHEAMRIDNLAVADMRKLP
jgi:hypothetical protein